MGDDGPVLCPTFRALILARPEAREWVEGYIQEVVEARYPRKKALASLCEVIEILEPSARAGVTVIDGQRTCIETAVFPRCGENFSKSIDLSPNWPAFHRLLRSSSDALRNGHVFGHRQRHDLSRALAQPMRRFGYRGDAIATSARSER